MQGHNYIDMPSDNMQIEGVYLNELIQGYRQLSVGGRALIPRENEATPLPSGGVWIDNSRVTERIIIIQYQLIAESSEALREQYATLNKFLHQFNRDNLAQITFDDEPEWSYYGLMNEAPMDVLEDRLSFVSEFSLLIPQVTKQHELQRSTGMVNLKYANKVNPTKLVFRSNTTTNVIEVTNGHGEQIRLVGAYDAGEPITLEWHPYHISLTYRGRNHLMDIDYTSFPEEFYLRDNDRITVKDGSVVELTWRDEQL